MSVFSYNLRGTSGTGKTTVARALLEKSRAMPVKFANWSKKNKPIVYRGHIDALNTPIVFLGSYEANCGGCDTIPSVWIVASLLKEYMAFMEDMDNNRGIVFFEGLMISHMLGTVGKAQEELGKHRNVLAFLDTPLDVCLERVRGRRVAAGNLAPLNPDNTIKDHRSVHRCKARAVEQGYFVTEVPHDNALYVVEQQLEALVHGLPVPYRLS